MVLVALVIGGVFMLSIVWWKWVAPTLPPMNPDNATSGTPPAYMAEHLDELPLNPAAPGRPDLFEVRKPISQSIVYPGLRLGLSLDDARAALNKAGLKFTEHPESKVFPQGIWFRVMGRLPGIKEELPISIFANTEEGEGVGWLQLDTDEIPYPTAQKIFEQCAGRFLPILFFPNGQAGTESKGGREASRVYEWKAPSYSLSLRASRTGDGEEGRVQILLIAGGGLMPNDPAPAGK